MAVGDVVGAETEVEVGTVEVVEAGIQAPAVVEVAEAEVISEEVVEEASTGVVEEVSTEVAETSEASTEVEVEGAVGVAVPGNKEGM